MSAVFVTESIKGILSVIDPIVFTAETRRSAPKSTVCATDAGVFATPTKAPVAKRMAGRVERRAVTPAKLNVASAVFRASINRY